MSISHKIPVDQLGTRPSPRVPLTHIEVGWVTQAGDVLVVELSLENWEIVCKEGYLTVKEG